MLSPQNQVLISKLEVLKKWLKQISIAPKDSAQTVETAIKAIKTLG